MGDTGFLSALVNFPKEGITDETVELLKPYFSAPDFNFESAKKVRVLLSPVYMPILAAPEPPMAGRQLSTRNVCRRPAEAGRGHPMLWRCDLPWAALHEGRG